MAASRQRANAIRAYIRRLENPYAKLQLDIEDPAKNLTPKLTLSGTENPYATDYFCPDPELESECSKSLFESTCRQIFVMYVPEAERPRLRAHHRDFIQRNASRNSKERAAICSELKRYNLSDVCGLDPVFNREDDPFTSSKLQLLEKKVFGKK